MTALAVALPLLPALAAAIGLLLPPRFRSLAAGIALAGTGLSLAAATALAATLLGDDDPVAASGTLAEFGDLAVVASVRVDGTTAVVSVAVALVAFCVQAYSTGYLRADDRYAPYAAQVSLFTAAMLLVVVAGDLVVLLVGWEVMGLCSYLLIGHDRALPEAPAAAVKAFLVTRVGDVGFLLGVVVLGVNAGSFRIVDVLAAAADGRISSGALTAATLLLLVGVVGKSAQVPLHTWLPDAMAGPTPVSALIHAATMVAAGVVVLARLFPLYAGAAAEPAALTALAVVAAVTMVLGACAALASDDLKRVLAWSTVSQVAYMFGGLAVGAVDAGLFHLLTHAAFKALLFLAAGALIHAAGSTIMASMGGLRRGMSVTFWVTTVGLAALAGVPPFAGFFSKEAVLTAAHHAAVGEAVGGAPVPVWAGWLVLVAGTLAAGLTAAYVTRLWLRVFFGAPRSGTAPHEPPLSMRWPPLLLAVPSALLGVVALGPSGWLVPADADVEEAGLVPEAGTTAVTVAAVAVGVLATWLVWRRDTAADPARALGPLRPVFAEAFYLDAVQRALVVRPAQAVARAVKAADAGLVDGAVEGVGAGAGSLGRVTSAVHRGLPRYAAAVLAGSVLLGVAAVVLGAAPW